MKTFYGLSTFPRLDHASVAIRDTVDMLLSGSAIPLIPDTRAGAAQSGHNFSYLIDHLSLDNDIALMLFSLVDFH